MPKTLITDLDGTLIPGKHADPQAAHAALAKIQAFADAENNLLVYSSGRSLDLIKNAIETIPLPVPHMIVADVGTSIYTQRPFEEGSMFVDAWALQPAYQAYLQSLMPKDTRNNVQYTLSKFPQLSTQPEGGQGPFKVSYHTPYESQEVLTQAVSTQLESEGLNLQVVGSRNKEENKGFIDILPPGISKAGALSWLVTNQGWSKNDVAFAGDSGNDSLALVSGVHGIVVGNAEPTFQDTVRTLAAENSVEDLVYFAQGHETLGVVEGLEAAFDIEL